MGLSPAVVKRFAVSALTMKISAIKASISSQIEIGSSEVTNVLFAAGNIVATGILAGRSASTSDYATLAGFGSGYDITGSG